MAEEEAPEVEAGGNEGGSGYALMTDAWPDMVKVGQAEYHHHLCRHHYRLARNGKDRLTQHHIINIKQESWPMPRLSLVMVIFKKILLSLSSCCQAVSLQHQLQINNSNNNF